MIAVSTILYEAPFDGLTLTNAATPLPGEKFKKGERKLGYCTTVRTEKFPSRLIGLS
jgi:hypothetical protein